VLQHHRLGKGFLSLRHSSKALSALHSMHAAAPSSPMHVLHTHLGRAVPVWPRTSLHSLKRAVKWVWCMRWTGLRHRDGVEEAAQGGALPSEVPHYGLVGRQVLHVKHLQLVAALQGHLQLPA